MKHVVIGTAGHIDHGKSTLVKALTNIDPDRLKEEKERGITIELGFAYFDLPSGRRAGIVDVPGHERFIKHMLAGVSGMDLVMLVVAADEGVMPQTTEHLDILSLLQVKKGVVILSKADLVDEEWLELVTEQVRETVKGTFLQDAPIIPVDSVSRRGLSELAAVIDRLAEELEARDSTAPFRLPIDRVFTVAGFGTVVTGTLLSGTLRVGDKIEIMPSGKESRVRGIQNHGRKVEAAYAGQRVAVNLAGLDRDEVARGDTIAVPGLLSPTMMFDARLHMLARAPRTLANRERVRLYHGTREVFGRVVILDQEEIKPGHSALVQFRLEEPLAAAQGDLFVLRTYSPMVTVGGGTVLEPHPQKKGRFKAHFIEELLLKEKGSPLERFAGMIERESSNFPTREDLVKLSQLPTAEADKYLETLTAQEIVTGFSIDQKEYFAHAVFLQRLQRELVNLLSAFHRENPLKRGMGKEEIRSRMLPKCGVKLFNALLLYWEGEGAIRQSGAYVALPDFTPTLTDEQRKMRDAMLLNFRENHFSPPSPEEAASTFGNAKAEALAILSMLLEEGTLIKINEDFWLTTEAYHEAREKILRHFQDHATLSLGEFRDLLHTSRKYALPLLEHFDQKKLTLRKGDVRVLNPYGAKNLP